MEPHNTSKLFTSLIQPVKFTNCFCPFTTSMRELEELKYSDIKIAATTNNKSFFEYQEQEASREWQLYYGEPHHFSVDGKFHYAFCDLRDCNKAVSDVFGYFHCSKSKDLDNTNRVGQQHFMLLESMYNSIMPGTFFGAVLPRKWQGRNMRYMTWFRNRIATVANIKLPAKVNAEVNADEYSLLVFTKNINESHSMSQAMPFALFRYNEFNYTLPGYHNEDVINMAQAFQQHDWYTNYVCLSRDFVERNSNHAVYRHGRYVNLPKLSDPADTVMFMPKKECSNFYIVKSSLDEIQEMPMAVHVKVGNNIRLTTYSRTAACLLLELKLQEGYSQQSQNLAFKFDIELSVAMFHDYKDELCRKLKSIGLVPVILNSDYQRLQKEERRIDIQLTPVARTVKQGDTFENIYADMDMEACYAPLLEQQKARMKKMKMDLVLFDYQFEDVAAIACKQRSLNCNVMGLGKTLEVLMAYLLKTNKKCLIVVPSKLKTEWLKEIKTRLLPYVRMARQNWRKENLLKLCTVQIIEDAEDCLPENLKAINIVAYEKLTRQPADAHYFYCKKCKTSVCSLKLAERMLCPVCNFERRKKWKEECTEKGLRKHKIKGGTQVDNRPPLASLVYMERSKRVLYKQQKVQVGVETKHVITGGQIVPTAVPKYIYKKRNPHLRWTFSKLLRNRFSFIAVDEADYIKNEKSQRSNAVCNLVARTKISCTGTPMRGFPASVLNMLNWTLRRNTYPEYRVKSDPEAMRRFNDKFKEEVTIISGGTIKRKVLPKIRNPELFQTELAPFMVRHTRNEPEVIACIGKKEIVGPELTRVRMDEQHRDYYQLWLNKFQEWWERMKEEEEGKKAGKSIIVKLGYLINASCNPHFMLERILKGTDEEGKEWAREIGKYKGPLTQKQEKAFAMVKENYRRMDKSIVFSIRRASLKIGKQWCLKRGIPSLIVDGSVSRSISKLTGKSKRQELIEAFQYDDYGVLWAGLKAMRDGANIPEANHGIFLDLWWDPTDYRQAAGRMIRPAQQKPVYLTHLVHEGTLDEYVSMVAILKARSGDEGIDYMEFNDFSTEMIPDCFQYANAIVDGTEKILKARMELAIDRVRKLQQSGEDSI